MSPQQDQIDEAFERIMADVRRNKRLQAKRRRRLAPRQPNGLQDPLNVAGEPGLLMTGQAAAYLGITDDQVAAFVQDGELNYINVGRGKKRARYRFTIPDLQEFIERRRRREVLCRSTSQKGHRTTTSTSRPEVIGFMAARAAQLGKKPKPTKR
jgi:excisionase family DNA binding protein